MKFAQYTNSSIGPVSINAAMPIGILTQKCMTEGRYNPTFTSGTSGANLININEVGKYRVSYTATVQAESAGNLMASLVVNNVTANSVTVTMTEDGYANIELDYILRVCNNCSSITTNFPATLQIILGGAVPVSGGNSNLIIEQIA